MRPGTQLHSAVVPRGRSARSAALGVTVRRIPSTHMSSRGAGALCRRLVVGLLVLASLVLITMSFRSGDDGPLSGVQSAGATVLRGPLGFGHSSVLHTTKIVRLSQDLPIVIEIIDAEEKINAFVDAIEDIMGSGLMTLEKVKVIQYGTERID